MSLPYEAIRLYAATSSSKGPRSVLLDVLSTGSFLICSCLCAMGQVVPWTAHLMKPSFQWLLPTFFSLLCCLVKDDTLYENLIVSLPICRPIFLKPLWKNTFETSSLLSSLFKIVQGQRSYYIQRNRCRTWILLLKPNFFGKTV